MLLTHLVPSDAVGDCGTSNTAKPKPVSHKCCWFSARKNAIKEQDERHTYCILKRKWLLGRSQSEDPFRNNANKALQRRMSIPMAKGKKDVAAQEMTTPVKGTTSWWRVSNTTATTNNSNQKSSFMWFWRNEEVEDFHTALEGIDITSAADIEQLVEAVRKYIDRKYIDGKPNSATDLAEIVQDVYRTVEVQLREKVLFHDITPERSYLMMADFEEAFIRHFHCEIFRKITVEEEGSDHLLSSKIEDLYWIRAKHLAANIEETDQFVLGHLDKAMLALATINFRESATEKLACVMECSRKIFDSLRCHSDSSGADEFLPILIYVVLQANPAHLHSNIRYMLQFSNTDRIMKGEEGYYFTHLCSVVSYIENITAESLAINKEEFERNCNRYRDEEEETDDISKIDYPNYRRLSRYICDLYHRTAEEQVFKERQEKLWEKAAALQKRIDDIKVDLALRKEKCQRNRQNIEKMMTIRYRDIETIKPCSHCPQRNASI